MFVESYYSRIKPYDTTKEGIDGGAGRKGAVLGKKGASRKDARDQVQVHFRRSSLLALLAGTYLLVGQLLPL